MRNGSPIGSKVSRTARARRSRFVLLAAAAVVALHGFVAGSSAQTNAPAASERSVKAAFLYKFTEYVDWPAQGPRGDSFTIGVLGSGAFADELLRMTEDRRVDSRFIRVRRVSSGDGFDDLQVLFVAGDQRGKLGELLSAARGKPILTVTESEGALADGSVINFTTSGDRVRFEVSLDAAQASRLRLNSRLLAVAQNIQQSQPP